MAQVFISYASLDRAVAGPIVEAISQAGLNPWHPSEITLGGYFVDQLRREIETAQCVIVLWSKAAAQSLYVQQEIHQAIQAWSSDRLVLAVLDEAPLPVGLRDLSAISIKSASDPSVQVLIERAKAIVGLETIALAETFDSVSSKKSAPTELLPPPPAAKVSVGPRISRRPNARFSRSGLIFVGVLVAGLVLLVGSVGWQASPPAGPPDPSYTFTGQSLSITLVVLVLGAAIGAVAVFASTARSRERLKRTPSTEFIDLTPLVPKSAPLVFVSYSRQDGRTVEQLVQQIEQLGYEVWIDRQSTGSQRYAAPIVQAIRTSRLVALMCSQNAFASDHVTREVYVAGDYKKPFIAFQLDPTEFPDDLLYFVTGFPRIPVATIDPQQLRSEIARLIKT